jgi:uncharacterized protein YjbI with pentapeptide repeats
MTKFAPALDDLGVVAPAPRQRYVTVAFIGTGVQLGTRSAISNTGRFLWERAFAGSDAKRLRVRHQCREARLRLGSPVAPRASWGTPGQRLSNLTQSLAVGLYMVPLLFCFVDPMGLFAAPSPAFKLPPVDMTDPNRCNLTSSTIGQANAARDKFLDGRFCDLRGRDFSGYDLSGVLLEGATADEARFRSTQLSKAYAPGFKCRRCDFEDAVVDRVNFENADLSGSVFRNAVLSDSMFSDGTNVRDVDFTDVYIGEYGLRRLCRNPTLDGENPLTGAPTRASLGCRAER